jgi:hypothetical protein
MTREFETANRQSLAKLRRLVERLTDAELALSTTAGWTVSSAFAHMAFYDFRALYLLEHWREAGISPSPFDVDAVNAAQKPLCLALPPRAAAALALQAAEAVDAAIEGTADGLVQGILDAKVQFKFERHEHRLYHLEEIERALGGSV